MMMKRHNSPTTKECIPACVKAGGAYVLLDPATKTIYELDDQKKPAPFAEQNVKVTGTYDKATQTIQVSGITATKKGVIINFLFRPKARIQAATLRKFT